MPSLDEEIEILEELYHIADLENKYDIECELNILKEKRSKLE